MIFRDNIMTQPDDATAKWIPPSIPSDATASPPLSQKKLGGLEQLKEELRRKQELLDRKRNDFRRQTEELDLRTDSQKNREDDATTNWIPSDAPPSLLPLSRKKLDSLEQLKEELRKKQELLDQKRNDFRRKLNELEKQAVGVKGDVVTETVAKRHKLGTAADAKAAARSSDSGGAVASPRAEIIADKNTILENVVSHSPKSNRAVVLQESPSFEQQIRPVAPIGPPFLMDRYKLDNRPTTTFEIIPPLPAADFADVAVLKEHFSSYGDLSTVELEDGQVHENGNELDTLNNCSARITFTTRRSAEKAFLNGKCWKGHDLQFMWLMPSNDPGNKETTSSAQKGSLDADVQKEEKSASIVSQETAASGNGESENSERKSSVEHAELQEVSQHSRTPMSDAEESTKDNFYRCVVF